MSSLLVQNTIVRSQVDNEQALFYVERSLSHNTRISYGYDLASFEQWGGVLPADGPTIVKYLLDHADVYNTRTLERRLKTLRYWHKLKKFPDPTGEIEVMQVMKGIKRVQGKAPVKATPILKEDLAVIDKVLYNPDAGLIDFRDNALMQIGFYGAFRRSELVSIQVEHLKFNREGVEIFVPKSKTDQNGDGAICPIPRFTSRPCPVETLEVWLQSADIKSGPVFRSFHGKGDMSHEALDPKIVNTIIKKLVKRCKIGNPDDYSGHSLRRGFATSSTKAGASLEALMRHGRWKNASTVIGYIDEAERFVRNPVSLMDR